jgi:hypothetical protein
MRAATSAPATQRPRPAAMRAAAMAAAVASGTVAPETPALTAGDEAGLLYLVDQGVQARPLAVISRKRGGDADRGNAHGGAVGVAGGAGFLRRGAGLHGGQRAAGGGAEQVERAPGLHVRFPGDQGGGQFAGVDPAVARDEQAAEQDGLLGVVSDVTGQVTRGDGVPVRCRLEPGQQRAPAGHDLRARQQLGGHAERVADRQAVQRAPGPAGLTGGLPGLTPGDMGKIGHQSRCFSRETRPVKLRPGQKERGDERGNARARRGH